MARHDAQAGTQSLRGIADAWQITPAFVVPWRSSELDQIPKK